MKFDFKHLKWKAFAATSGPGGQHVNKVATAMELRCKIKDLELPEAAEARLRAAAGKRVNSEGELVLVAKEHKSQERNRLEAIEKLVEFVLEAGKAPKKRRATRPTKGSKERRLVGKKKRSDVKKLRQGRE
ncbi:MAG: aminoacyl-tRNA hydrolase [Proteobacteria bacterium]|nr:aminoacyl-tRNA hydrolase [Pseudomonadota bacterium]